MLLVSLGMYTWVRQAVPIQYSSSSFGGSWRKLPGLGQGLPPRTQISRSSCLQRTARIRLLIPPLHAMPANQRPVLHCGFPGLAVGGDEEELTGHLCNGGARQANGSAFM